MSLPFEKHVSNAIRILLKRTLFHFPDRFLDQVYAEHNRIRRKEGLSTLRIDTGLQKILQRLGFNSAGHDHSQQGNLQCK